MISVNINVFFPLKSCSLTIVDKFNSCTLSNEFFLLSCLSHQLEDTVKHLVIYIIIFFKYAMFNYSRIMTKRLDLQINFDFILLINKLKTFILFAPDIAQFPTVQEKVTAC